MIVQIVAWLSKAPEVERRVYVGDENDLQSYHDWGLPLLNVVLAALHDRVYQILEDDDHMFLNRCIYFHDSTLLL